MKQIVIISGKGGTGKTIVTASFASLVRATSSCEAVMADCDVDAADLHILLHPSVKEKHEFKGGKMAVIDKEKCTECGKCAEVCRFEAIKEIRSEKKARGGYPQFSIPKSVFYIESLSCEGCGVCSYICPEKAIRMEEKISGEWYISETKYGPFVHAKMGIAEENSGKLVTVVRENAKTVAERESFDYVIIDGPPGIGCPAIASLSGVNSALVVTEPSVSGIHDMERIIEVAGHFGIPTVVCINKYDLNIKNTKAIEKYCQSSNISVIGKIPFDEIVIKALTNRMPVVEYSDSQVTKEIKSMWEKIKEV